MLLKFRFWCLEFEIYLHNLLHFPPSPPSDQIIGERCCADLRLLRWNYFSSSYQTLRKNGKPDKRGTEKLELTHKGLATLLIEGDLQKDELVEAGRISLQESFGILPAGFLRGVNLEEIFANIFLKMKPKVNLKFFDETHFSRTLMLSFMETVIEAVPKVRRQASVATKVTAEQMKRKYVHPSQVDQLRDIHRFLVSERDRFTHLVNLFDALLKESERE